MFFFSFFIFLAYANFEFPFGILNVIQNPSGELKLLFLFFSFWLSSLLEFQYGILKETLNHSSEFNSFYSAPFELKSKKCSLILMLPVFNWLWLILAGDTRGNSTAVPETPANHIKAPLPLMDFHWTQKLTSPPPKKNNKNTIQNRPLMT